MPRTASLLLALVLVGLAGAGPARALGPGGVVPFPSPATCIDDQLGPRTECPTHAPALAGASAVVASADGKNVYVASFASHSVVELARNPDGSLRNLGCVQLTGGSDCGIGAPGLVGPRALAIAPDGQDLYVLSQDAMGRGVIAELARDDAGELLSLPGANGCLQETGGLACPGNASARGLIGAEGIAVSRDGKNVYVAFDGAHSPGVESGVSEFTRNPGGSLTQLAGAKACVEERGTGTECTAKGIGLTDAEGLAASPDGRNVYVAARERSGANVHGTVAEFSRSASDGSLAQAAPPNACIEETGGSECPTTVPGLGREPQSIVLTPDGDQAYVLTQPLNDMESAAIVELRRGAGGSLAGLPSPNGCVGEIGGDCATSARGLVTGTVGTLTVSPDGGNLFVPLTATNGKGGSLATFRVRADGSLTQSAINDGACLEETPSGPECANSASGLAGADGVAVAPDNRALYVSFRGATAADGGVTPFRRILPPTCRGGLVRALPSTPTRITLSCADPENTDVLRLITAAPRHGRLGAIDAAHARVTYTSASRFSGLDSFSFMGRNDYSVPSGPATVTIAVPPGLSRVSQSSRRWRERRAKHRRRSHVPVGTVFHLKLTAKAKVGLAFTHFAAGRRVGRRCAAPTHKNRHRRRCVRALPAGALMFTGRPGANALPRFTGRVRRRRLRPGSYRVTLVAVDAARLRSKPRSLRFRILTP